MIYLMKKITFLILLAITSCSYEQDVIEGKDAIQLSFRLKTDRHNSDVLTMSQVYDSVRYIQLDDVRQTVLIGEVSELQLTNEYIYIYDRHSDAVYKYDYDGAFVQKYYHKGRGPGEYVTITTFDIDRRNGNVLFYDVTRRMVIAYSDDNKFLYEYKIQKDVPRDFAVLNNGDHLFLTYDYMKGVRRGIWQCDSLGVVKNELVKIDESFKFSSGLFPSYFKRLGDVVYVRSSEDRDCLYHISGDSISIPYKFNFDIDIPNRIKTSPTPEMTQQNRGKVYAITEYFETKNWILASATNLISNHMVFYNKSSNKQYYITSPESIIDDMPPTGHIMATNEDYFVGVLSVDYILSYETLRQKFPLINEASNPVISISKSL